MSKGPGKKFEEDFVKSIPEGCDITRLKDAGGWSNATNMRFTSSNPCDFIVYSESGGVNRDNENSIYKLELKSVAGKSLPFSNIKTHQMESLCESGYKGVWSLFVVNFRGINETYWIAAHVLRSHIATCGRKSLSAQNAKLIGNLILQTLIRVRWRYDLEWL